MIKNIWNWLVKSSENPAELSLTLKGFIPLLALLGLGNYVSVEDATGLIDGFIALIVLGAQFVTAAIGIIGLLRKIRNTFTA